MSIAEQTRSTAAPAQAKGGTGGPAGVEIMGFPQILYTRTFGDPDALFVPLLGAAQEAVQMVERLCERGEKRESAIMLSGMQLATSLLRDSSFSLGARGLSHEHSYTVNLEAGTLLVKTRLYAVVSRRASFFMAEIAGKILGGPFVVRDPVKGTVILQVNEESLKEPNFFSSVLAQECLRARIEQEHAGRGPEPARAPAKGEIRMVMQMGGKELPVVLRPQENGASWDIVDGRSNECIGTLAPELESSLGNLVGTLKELFASR